MIAITTDKGLCAYYATLICKVLKLYYRKPHKWACQNTFKAPNKWKKTQNISNFT